MRRAYLTVATLKRRHPLDAEMDQLYRRAFGYPEDMPDLRSFRPPGGNAVTGSEHSCHYALSERDELPDEYQAHLAVGSPWAAYRSTRSPS